MVKPHKSPIPKVVLNAEEALEETENSAKKVAINKFSHAIAVTGRQPHGLAPVSNDPLGGGSEHSDVVSAEVVALPRVAGQVAVHTTRVQSFDLSTATVGSIVRAPLGIIDLNPLSPRHIYTANTVDKIAATFSNGQDDAAHGYVENGRIKLIDGGTRHRAAVATSAGFLDVKIEDAPKDKLHLFLRARELNETRSPITPLDFALSLKSLLDEGAVQSQVEIVTAVMGPSGRPMTEVTVSRYLRIARQLPESLQRMMSEADETCSYAALFAISELFPESLTETEREERLEMGEGIIDEIKRKKLSKLQIQALVKTKIDGPKTRERSSVHQLNFGVHKGHIKLFARKGKLDLSLQGLSEERLPQLRETIEAAIKQFLASP